MPLDSIILHIPAIIKASTSNGKRIVEVEASSEAVDSEGDVILQKALMDSATSFLKTGNLDIDHISEIGGRLGIKNPASYIVGRPIEVKDLGKGRTSVIGEIRKSLDGHDPEKNHYDSFWDSLQSDPPVIWRASIFGFPLDGGVEDCSSKTCEKGATRWLVKSIDWRSLAFTRNPINTDLKGTAKIVSSKAFVEFIMKSNALQRGGEVSGLPSFARCGGPEMAMSADMPAPYTPPIESMPYNMNELAGQYLLHIKGGNCPHVGETNSVAAFKAHFEICCGASSTQADIHAHALMYHALLESKRSY